MPQLITPICTTMATWAERGLRKVTLLLALGLSLAVTPPAHALVIDFSFTGVAGFCCSGAIAGTVSGELTGLVNNANNQTPTAIILTSITPGTFANGGWVANAPLTLPLDLYSYMAAHGISFDQGPSVSVQNGVVTAVDIGTNGGFFDLNKDGAYNGLQVFWPSQGLIFNGNGFGGATYSVESAAVPEPAPLTLFGLGLAVLGLRRFRRRT